MMVLPDWRAPPLNENVADALVFDTTRSTLAIEKEINVEALPTPPDVSALDPTGSALVIIVTSPAERDVWLMVKPCKVIVTEALPGSVDPAVVITIVDEFGIPMEVRLLPGIEEKPTIPVVRACVGSTEHTTVQDR